MNGHRGWHSPALSRRGLLRWLGATGGAASLSGLAVRSGITAPSRALQAGGELIVGAPGDRHSTEPPLPNIGMSIPNPNIFETLVRLSSTFQVEPALAEAWAFVEPNTWRFTLRQGVTFHDGTPFTAEAVAWTMARVAASGGGVLGIGETSTKVIDDFTVEITPVKENRRLPLQLSAPRTGSIIAPNSDVVQARIGTGPFREVEYVKDERHVVEAYEGYWGEKAKLAKLTFRYLPDPTTRFLALQAGEVDVIYDVPRESAVDVESGDGMQLVASEIGAYEALYVNIHGTDSYGLGQDPAVRLALAQAIDREAIAAVVWQGYAEPDKTMVPAAVLGDAASMVQGVAYDPEAAKQTLETAGWTGDGTRQKDGRDLKLTMVVGYPSAEIHGSMPELVQAQLKEVGIELELVKTPDIGTYESRLQSGEGDLWAEVGNQVDADPSYLLGLLFSSPTPDADPEMNMYANAFAPGPAFDALIDEVGKVSEPAEIQRAAAMAIQLLIDQEHVVLPLVGIRRLYGVSDKVAGFSAHPVQFVQRWEAVGTA